MSVYILLKKKQADAIYLPTFEVCSQRPVVEERQKLFSLEEGECIDVADFSILDKDSYIMVQQYRISNLNNQAHQQLTEQYSLPRFGK